MGIGKARQNRRPINAMRRSHGRRRSKGIERRSIQRDYVREKSLDSLLMNVAERDGAGSSLDRCSYADTRKSMSEANPD